MRKDGIAVMAFAMLAIPLSAHAASKDDMVGKWKWTDFVVEVTKCTSNPSGEAYCATVVSGPKNVGMEMIRSKLEQRGAELVGKIAHPATGDVYNTKLKMSNPDTWTLDGCTDANVCATGDFVRVK